MSIRRGVFSHFFLVRTAGCGSQRGLNGRRVMCALLLGVFLMMRPPEPDLRSIETGAQNMSISSVGIDLFISLVSLVVRVGGAADESVSASDVVLGVFVTKGGVRQDHHVGHCGDKCDGEREIPNTSPSSLWITWWAVERRLASVSERK